jgi:hypothetical protein
MVYFHDVDEESPCTWGYALNGNGLYSQQTHPNPSYSNTKTVSQIECILHIFSPRSELPIPRVRDIFVYWKILMKTSPLPCPGCSLVGIGKGQGGWVLKPVRRKRQSSAGESPQTAPA